jgi:hypothetical protein
VTNDLTKIPKATERRGGRTRRESSGERKIRLGPKKMPIRKSYASCTDLDGAETADQVEFIRAMDRYQTAMQRKFPRWTEVLDVLLSLGYRKCPDPNK